MHKLGLGFLGFTKTTSVNNITGAKIVSEYAFNDTYLMMPLTATKTYINNNSVTTTQYTNGCVALSGGNGYGYYKQLFPYVSIVENTEHLTGALSFLESVYGTISEITLNKGNCKSSKKYYGSMTTPQGWELSEYTYASSSYTLPDSRIISLLKLTQQHDTKKIGGTGVHDKYLSFTYSPDSRLLSTTDFYGLAGAVTNTMQYTACGNISAKTTSASGMTSRSIAYTYDAKERFVLTETDVLGSSKSYTYDEATGNVLTVVDISNNTTQNTYNSFGFLTATDFPNNLAKNYSLHWATTSGIPNAVYYQQVVDNNAPDIKICFDAAGREIYSQWDGLGDEVASAKSYNAKGQLFLETKPHYLNSGSKEFIVTKYDSYGRILKVTDSCINASTERAITNFTYNGLTSTVTDPAGIARTKTVNQIGQIIQATDPGGTITYSYDEQGNLKSVTSGGGTITYGYDAYGRKISETDPNTGTATFQYDNFGQLTSQTDANNRTYSITYDIGGRAIQKTGPEGNYNYSFYSSGNGKGLPENIEGPNNFDQHFEYDNLGQLTSKTESLDGDNYSYYYANDDNGNQVGMLYPNGFGVYNVYNSLGMLSEVRRFDNNDLIWKLNSQDPVGRPIQIEHGNGVVTNYQYDAHNFLTNINGSNNVQADQYTWNYLTGNLMSRSDIRLGLSETFSYDNLDRLTAITMSGNNKQITYQGNGNIASKTDAGTYAYDANKIHAVTSIMDNSNNSAISPLIQDITCTAFYKISQITEGGNAYKLNYSYGPDMERRKMVMTANGNAYISREYVGLYEKELDANGQLTRDMCYIAGANGITAVYMSNQLYYLRRDHQGSVTGLIDQSGNIVEEYSYDAWGRRRNPANWIFTNVPAPQYMYRGYTFHEHMDEFGLINMNGRAYDPFVGRFLNPDPVIQNTANTQNYNRYAYCLNNPLKYNDPSGYMMTNWGKKQEQWMNMNRTLQENFNNWYVSTTQWAKDMVKQSIKLAGANSIAGAHGGGVLGNILVQLQKIISNYKVEYVSGAYSPKQLDICSMSVNQFVDHWLHILAWEGGFGDRKFTAKEYFDFNNCNDRKTLFGDGYMPIANIKYFLVVYMNKNSSFDFSLNLDAIGLSQIGKDYKWNTSIGGVETINADPLGVTEIQFAYYHFKGINNNGLVGFYANNYYNCQGNFEDGYNRINGDGLRMQEYLGSRSTKVWYYWNCGSNYWRY